MLLLSFLSLSMGSLLDAAPVSVASPNKAVVATVAVDDSKGLRLSITRDKKKVLNKILLGTVIDGKDIGKKVSIAGSGKISELNTSYPWFGSKSRIVNHCNYLILPIKTEGMDKTWNLELKVFDDGVAFRYVVHCEGEHKIDSESTSFDLLKGSEIWYRLNKPQYERLSKLSDVEKIESGFNMQLPVTIELPGDMGYAAITEAGSFL